MEYHTTEGIVLKKIPHEEHDALYDIYTKEFGKVRARAQGVQKEGAKLKGHLEPLSMVRVTFVQGRHGERLTHATMMKSWEGIRQSLEKIAGALRMADMVDHQCFPGQADQCVWNLFLESLLVLEEHSFAGEVLVRFSERFARCQGLPHPL